MPARFLRLIKHADAKFEPLMTFKPMEMKFISDLYHWASLTKEEYHPYDDERHNDVEWPHEDILEIIYRYGVVPYEDHRFFWTEFGHIKSDDALYECAKKNHENIQMYEIKDTNYKYSIPAPKRKALPAFNMPATHAPLHVITWKENDQYVSSFDDRMSSGFVCFLNRINIAPVLYSSTSCRVTNDLFVNTAHPSTKYEVVQDGIVTRVVFPSQEACMAFVAAFEDLFLAELFKPYQGDVVECLELDGIMLRMNNADSLYAKDISPTWCVPQLTMEMVKLMYSYVASYDADVYSYASHRAPFDGKNVVPYTFKLATDLEDWYAIEDDSENDSNNGSDAEDEDDAYENAIVDVDDN